MIRKIDLVFTLFLLSTQPALALSSNTAITWLADPAIGLFKVTDFTQKTNDKGENILKADKLNTGITIVEKDNTVREISFVVGFDNENEERAIAMMLSLSKRVFPEWENAIEWTKNSIRKDGTHKYKSEEKHLEIQCLQHLLCHYYITIKTETSWWQFWK